MIVTPEEIRKSVIENKVTFLPIHNCSICNVPIGYSFFKYNCPYEVTFDSSCGCCNSGPRPSSYEDVADHINMQTSEEYINELITNLGLIRNNNDK